MLEKQAEKGSGTVFSRVLTGLSLFALVAAVYSAMLLLAYGPSGFSLALGCRWDCGWYRSIAVNGYVSEIPPTPQDLDRSNVAFFPLYPILGRTAAAVTGLPIESALPLVSILFAAGIFALVPLLADRKRTMLALAFPAAFYFFVAYSESVFCFSLFAGLLALWRRERLSFGATAFVLLVSGFALGLTRLTGFMIPGGVLGILALGSIAGRTTRDRRLVALAAIWTFGAVAGAASFFLYSAAKFGAWDLYFQTLNIGWKKETSWSGFFTLFARALPKNVFPPLFARDPTRFSWMVNADVMILFAYALVLEGKALLAAAKGSFSSERSLRLALLAAGLVHVIVTSLGDSGNEHRWGNGMRYTMPMLFLLVFVWDSAWTPAWLKARPRLARFLYVGTIAYWVPYQLYYLYLFTRNGWVS